MLIRLSNGALYKKKELADYLEVTERKLIELRYDLVYAGFYIETISGKNGGYRLDKHRSLMFSVLNLNDDEFNSLKFIQKTLTNINDRHYKNFSSVIQKYEIKKQSRGEDYSIIHPVNENRLIEKENQNFETLIKAIKNSNKITFSYKKIDATYKTYTMHPYELFFYKGFWYLITYNEKYEKAYQYKLVRMNEIIILDEKYKKSPQFQLCDFTGSTSIFKDEAFHLELEIKPPRAVIISELSLAKDQVITEHEDGKITFKGTMEGKIEIINWLLSLGDDLMKIAPIEIEEAYLSVLKNMAKNHSI
ncbi:WYL domain-containing protein [Mycoplasmatota bacterium]|nr:WYL domain-containing protein [Mycoplasmatota bacterium]